MFLSCKKTQNRIEKREKIWTNIPAAEEREMFSVTRQLDFIAFMTITNLPFWGLRQWSLAALIFILAMLFKTFFKGVRLLQFADLQRYTTLASLKNKIDSTENSSEKAQAMYEVFFVVWNLGDYFFAILALIGAIGNHASFRFKEFSEPEYVLVEKPKDNEDFVVVEDFKVPLGSSVTDKARKVVRRVRRVLFPWPPPVSA